MEFYNKAKKIIDLGITEFTGGVTDDIINNAMETLGLEFPESYKAFLSDFGGGDAGGEIIFGLTANKNKHTMEYEGQGDIEDVVQITQMEHKYKMPGYMVVINYCESDGDGLFYCLDTSRMKDGECPVVKVPEDYKNIETVSESFGKFFYDYVKECLDDEY